LAARAQRPPVDDDRVLRARVRDEVAAGLERDRRVRARDESLGIGEHQRVDLASPDGPPGFLEAGRQIPVEWPSFKGDRANRQQTPQSSLPSRNESETAQNDFTPVGSPASSLNLLYFRDFRRLDYRRIQEAADGRAGKSTHVPGADGASPQDRSGL